MRLKTFQIHSAINGHFLGQETASSKLGALVSYYQRIGAPKPPKLHNGVTITETNQ